MIIGYCGLPGSGKTYAMSQDLLREMAHKRNAYVNYPLRGARYFTSLDQVLPVRKGVIGVDEIHMLAPSRMYRALPTQQLALWTQSRHMGIDFWFTAQSFGRVDISIRCVTNFVWDFHRVGNSKLHVGYLYDAIDVERERQRARPLKRRWFYESKKMYATYDTTHIVETASHLATTKPGHQVNPDELPIFDEALNANLIPTYEEIGVEPKNEALPNDDI